MTAQSQLVASNAATHYIFPLDRLGIHLSSSFFVKPIHYFKQFGLMQDIGAHKVYIFFIICAIISLVSLFFCGLSIVDE